MKKIFIAFALTLGLISPTTFAADIYYSGEAISVGNPGDPGNVSSTVEITMVDNRFRPSEISVKKGETIKFILKNTDKKKHKMVIGTPQELSKHAKMRKKFPDMEQPAQPNMVAVNPGKTGELIWHFTEAGMVNFACPMPSHSKNMHGTIEVKN